MYYFSDNSIKEIEKIVDDITILFPLEVQNRLLAFVNEIKHSKCCQLTDYHDILALVKKDEEKVSKKELKQIEEKKRKRAEKQLDYFVMMLVAKAFISLNCGRNALIITQEIKQESKQ